MYKLFLIAFLFIGSHTVNSVHKFYVSVTNIEYSEKEDAFQITTRIFIDDLEDILLERYELEAKLDSNQEAAEADRYIERYLRSKFAVSLDGSERNFTFIGKKYDNDVIICYLEVEQVNFNALKEIQVQNEVLMDLFEEQQNIVHMKWKGKKRSFVLIRENNKAMLKL